MDTILFMALVVLGAIAWVWAAIRQRSMVLAFLSAPACAILAWSFGLLLSHAQPVLWSGTAETGPVTTLIIAAGVTLMLMKPRQDDNSHDGGELSA